MAEDFGLQFGVLNIAARPHRDGTYVALLKKVAGKPVNFFDQDFAALSPPVRREAGLYAGRIMVWTELDPDAPAIDKAKLEEVTLEEANIELPVEFGINGRTFIYVLRERDHRIFFEWKNDLGHYLAPARFQKILDRLLYKTNTDGQIQVTVSVQSEHDALSQILKIPVIKSLEINITLPNPDDNDDETEEVLAELEARAAKAKHTKFEKRAGAKTLVPTNGDLKEARVAASGNGSVRAKGLDAKRRRVDMSTADFPMKIIKRVMDRAAVLAVAIAVAKETIVGRR